MLRYYPRPVSNQPYRRLKENALSQTFSVIIVKFELYPIDFKTEEDDVKMKQYHKRKHTFSPAPLGKESLKMDQVEG